MPLILDIFLRVLMAALGLALAAVLSVFFVVLVAAWLLRAAWARLTGRPVMPFAMRMGPHEGFAGMMRRARAERESRTPRADSAAGVRSRLGDVTDVEPK